MQNCQKIAAQALMNKNALHKTLPALIMEAEITSGLVESLSQLRRRFMPGGKRRIQIWLNVFF